MTTAGVTRVNLVAGFSGIPIRSELQKNMLMNQRINNSVILEKALSFLGSKGVEFSTETARIAEQTEHESLVIVMKPDALDPRYVIDPPDWHVRVVHNSEEIELLYRL